MVRYTSGGKIATTTVIDAVATPQGMHAADNGCNIVLDGSGNGMYHKSGAIRINSGTSSNLHDPSGAIYSNHLLGPGR